MIRIQNIYYMLAYAFRILHEQGYRDVAAEAFENVAELLTEILCCGVSLQIKRGLCRQYITMEEPLSSPRGKIGIGDSIKSQTLRKRQLVCCYDEFSINAYTNRIIKTTMLVLLRANISKMRKKEIRKLLIFFEGVDVLEPHNIHWSMPYDRNNQTYRMIIEICRFVMESDIVIASKETKKTLIIDAKYYSHNMQLKEPYMTQTIHSGNLYQIFTYVKNWEVAPDESVGGMLLYARTDDSIQPDNDYQMSGNQISVKTLDLNCDFAIIAAQLDSIAERVLH